jgi:hypothetical protein
MPDCAKFEMIPCIYAGDLSWSASNELSDWNDELCLHGDGGCVFYFHTRDIERLPHFTAWLIEVGIVTQEVLDNMPSIERYCSKMGISSKDLNSKVYSDYRDFCNGRKDYFKLAMQGT